MKFVTIFPDAENVHLRKGVAKIPYMLHKQHGYDSWLLTKKNAIDPQQLAIHTPGLNIKTINESNVLVFFNVLRYIILNAKNIDVLNLYSLSRSTFIWGFFYKMLHKKGILYVKLDMNYEYLQRLTKSEKNKRNALFWTWFFNKVSNLITFEAKLLGNLLEQFYSISNDRMHYMPIGVDVEALRSLPFERSDFEQKEKIILFSGRVGVAEKNSEMLLHAALKLNFNGWKIIFVGPISKAFMPVKLAFFQLNPEMIDKVLFTGNILDLEELSKWYNKAKVFCLTSRQESGPTALSEAMYWGNYIVSTKLCSVEEMLDYGNIGSLISTDEELIQQLQLCIDKTPLLKEKTLLGIKKIEDEVTWQYLVRNLKIKLDSLK